MSNSYLPDKDDVVSIMCLDRCVLMLLCKELVKYSGALRSFKNTNRKHKCFVENVYLKSAYCRQRDIQICIKCYELHSIDSKHFRFMCYNCNELFCNGRRLCHCVKHSIDDYDYYKYSKNNEFGSCWLESNTESKLYFPAAKYDDCDYISR